MPQDLSCYRLLKPDEAAAFLRCSKRTLARWRAEGIGPQFYRRGAHIVYSAAALLSWLDETMRTPVRSDARVPSVSEGVRSASQERAR